MAPGSIKRRRGACAGVSARILAITVASLGAVACQVSQEANRIQRPSIIPLPSLVEAGKGEFIMNSGTPVMHGGDADCLRVAGYFTDLVRRTRGLHLPQVSEIPGDAPAIVFRLGAVEGVTDEEGYSLDVSPRRIVVSSGTPRGLFYGAITLWQLATSDDSFRGNAATQGAAAQGLVRIGAVKIEDAPRFRWRGLMLDVARHYMPPGEIRRLIDWMALHKLNTLHWHLTDDQGWRIEILKYPRLTDVGAWRVPAGAAGRDPAGRPIRYGGFYTQDEVRQIVRYAAERHVAIVPEIEMPGHAQAAIAAYPELGTEMEQPPVVSSDWGIHTVLFNVEERTFSFLEDVLTEVMALFPGQYIHVGGDEAAKDLWEKSPRVQQRMRELGVADERQLQSLFIRRIERFLNANGRRLIGWDEILEGGLPPNATVMSWRGAAGGIEAASHGHDVVMAPAPVLYLDHLQSDSPDEPPGRPSLVTLADVYAFEPVPGEIGPAKARHVLGAQLNAWTEHMRTPARLQHAVFPRIAALAEVTWSQPGQRDFDDFMERLGPQLARYERLGIRYAKSALQPHATAQRLKGAQLLRRRDEEMRTCNDKLTLHLEDDAPASGERPVFLVDVIDPCWIYENAPLEGVRRIAVTVGQVPFNFQLWKDTAAIVTRPASTPAGELIVRLDRCDGEVLAMLPLSRAHASDELTTLETSLARASGTRDLCLAFATGTSDPLWVIDSVELRL